MKHRLWAVFNELWFVSCPDTEIWMSCYVFKVVNFISILFHKNFLRTTVLQICEKADFLGSEIGTVLERRNEKKIPERKKNPGTKKKIPERKKNAGTKKKSRNQKKMPEPKKNPGTKIFILLFEFFLPFSFNMCLII